MECDPQIYHIHLRIQHHYALRNRQMKFLTRQHIGWSHECSIFLNNIIYLNKMEGATFKHLASIQKPEKSYKEVIKMNEKLVHFTTNQIKCLYYMQIISTTIVQLTLLQKLSDIGTLNLSSATFSVYLQCSIKRSVAKSMKLFPKIKKNIFDIVFRTEE